MFKKLVSLLLVLAMIGSLPAAAKDAAESPKPEETASRAYAALDSSNHNLSIFYTLIPDFYVFAEKITTVFIYADFGQYEKAVEESEKLMLELKEMDELYKECYSKIADLIPEPASITLDIFDYYCGLSFRNCSNAMTALNNYINNKQTGISPTDYTSFREEFDTCYNNIYVIKQMTVLAFVASSSAFLEASRSESETANEVYESYSSNFKEAEFYADYLEHIEEHSAEYDLTEIPEAVYIDSEKASEDDKEIVTYTEGMYKVGTDIPEGEYIVLRNENERYFASVCVSADSNKDDILSYDLFDTHHYVTVKKGQYLELSGCTAVSAKDNRLIVKDVKNLTQGTYKVGTDIPAGEYKVTADPNATISSCCVQESSEADSQILTYNIVNNFSYITVKDGEYLILSDCTAALTD